MTTILTGKAITLKFATVEYHTQNEQAYITEEVDTENVETLGPDGGQVQVVFTAQVLLNLVALQDWTDADSLFALLNDAAQSGIDAEFELALTDAEGNVRDGDGHRARRPRPIRRRQGAEGHACVALLDLRASGMGRRHAVSDLVLQRVRVYLDLGDGVRHDLTVTLDHRDMRAYTVNAKRYGLPPIPPDADMPATTFFVTWQAWHAATREGLTELGWREWDARVHRDASHRGRARGARCGGPYEPGDWGHVIARLVLATGIEPDVWWDAEPRMLATVMSLLNE